MLYEEKLTTFANLATWFQELMIKHTYSDGRSWTSWSISAGNDRLACECCGTRRIKSLYPVAPDGDISRVKFIGIECHKNLDKMGKLHTWDFGYSLEV